jgi:hypothetical protein
LFFTSFHRIQFLTHTFLIFFWKFMFFLQNHTQFLAKEIVLPSLTAPISKVKTSRIPQTYSTLVTHDFHFKLSLQISSAWNIDRFLDRRKHSWTVTNDFPIVENDLRMLEMYFNVDTLEHQMLLFLDIWRQWQCIREERHALSVNWASTVTAVHLKTAVEPLRETPYSMYQTCNSGTGQCWTQSWSKLSLHLLRGQRLRRWHSWSDVCCYITQKHLTQSQSVTSPKIDEDTNMNSCFSVLPSDVLILREEVVRTENWRVSITAQNSGSSLDKHGSGSASVTK